MGTIYSKPDMNFNRFSDTVERDRFTIANESGMQWYTGANVRVYFDDIRVTEIDSFGFQLAQNVRPVYGYHTHVWSTLQYGTKLAQGYFQTALTEAAYIPTILATIEQKYRRGRGTSGPEINANSNTTSELSLGQTLEEATAEFSRVSAAKEKTTWRKIADQYDMLRWGMDRAEPTSTLNVPTLVPPKPNTNAFTYNPQGTHLSTHGFTITLLFGDPDIGLEEIVKAKETGDSTIYGTVKQLHEVHIIAGPNSQLDLDGKPVGELYTFLARDIT